MSKFINVTGLWINDKGNMTGTIKQDITIPAGSKIIISQNNQRPGTNDPAYKMSYILPESEHPAVAHPQEDDCPF